MKADTARRKLGVHHQIDNNRGANARFGHSVWLQLRVPRTYLITARKRKDFELTIHSTESCLNFTGPYR